jgi:hypothetical protein
MDAQVEGLRVLSHPGPGNDRPRLSFRYPRFCSSLSAFCGCTFA